MSSFALAEYVTPHPNRLNLLTHLPSKTVYCALVSPLSQVPGPAFAKYSSFDLKFASFKGRRAHVCLNPVRIYICSQQRPQKLLELHKRYGPVVRVGPNEISIGSWKYYRTIYNNPKTAHKLPAFYTPASFVGKDNIFQMT